MKRKIAVLFATLLLWTVGMSVFRVVFDQELNATIIGVIILVGAIVLLVSLLVGHIAKIKHPKIAWFFMCFLPWTSTMVFGRFISGEEVKAINVGIFVVMGGIFAIFVVLITRASEKSRR